MFKKKNKRSFVCAYCQRSISLEDEPNKEIKNVDGKPACPVCRATKFSKFSKEIQRDKKAYQKDKLELETISQKNALKEITEIAIASQDKNKETKINFFK